MSGIASRFFCVKNRIICRNYRYKKGYIKTTCYCFTSSSFWLQKLILKFRVFTLETTRKLLQRNVYLLVSVRKITINNSFVFQDWVSSVDELSQEAAEARNRDIKIFRFSASINCLEYKQIQILSIDHYLEQIRLLHFFLES